MEVQVGSGALAVGIGAVVVGLVAVERADEDRLLVHHSREVDALVSSGLVLLDVLGQRSDPTLHDSVLADPHLGILHLAALALLMADVEDEVSHLRLRVREAHEGDALGGRHFGIDVIVVEHHLIVTGRGVLVVVREA